MEETSSYYSSSIADFLRVALSEIFPYFLGSVWRKDAMSTLLPNIERDIKELAMEFALVRVPRLPTWNPCNEDCCCCTTILINLAQDWIQWSESSAERSLKSETDLRAEMSFFVLLLTLLSVAELTADQWQNPPTTPQCLLKASVARCFRKIIELNNKI